MMFSENRFLLSLTQQIPSVIPSRVRGAKNHALTCRRQTLRYYHFQIARVWFCRIRGIAKVGSARLRKPLPAPREGWFELGSQQRVAALRT
jgi:hypothetical protein